MTVEVGVAKNEVGVVITGGAGKVVGVAVACDFGGFTGRCLGGRPLFGLPAKPVLKAVERERAACYLLHLVLVSPSVGSQGGGWKKTKVAERLSREGEEEEEGREQVVERGNFLVQVCPQLVSDSALWLPSWEMAQFPSLQASSPTQTTHLTHTHRKESRLTFLTGRLGSGSISAIAVFPWSS